MSVSYNSKKIIPAPFVSIQKGYQRTGDGHLVGSVFNITLNGRLIPHKGSPNSAGVFWELGGYPADEVSTDKHSNLLVKRAALTDLFATEGKSLEFQAQDGSTPLRCYPKVKDIVFPEGIWVDYLEYTITLEANELFSSISEEDFFEGNDFFKDSDGNKLFLSSVDESWGIEEWEPGDLNNPHNYRVVHNVGAVGKEVYDGDGRISSGWEQARRWVESRKGIDVEQCYSSSGLNIPLYFTGYDHTIAEHTDEYNGSYNIAENWIFSSGNIQEDFSVSIKKQADEALTSVSIEGNIKGWETKTGYFVTGRKFSAADAKFNDLYNGYPLNTIYSRAVLYSGKSLNPNPMNLAVGRNPVGGTVTYNCEYNDRQTNYIANSLYEEFQISYGNAKDIFGSVPVLGRVAGPVLQDLNTISDQSITLSLDVVMPLYSGNAPITINGMIAMLAASPKTQADVVFSSFFGSLSQTYNQVFKSEDSEHWNPTISKYNRVVTYVYQ